MKIVDKEKKDVCMKIFIEVIIDGKSCGYDELDGEKHEFNFDMDYQRYRDNDKVRADAKSWAKHVVNKRIEEVDSSSDPVGESLEV